MLAGPPPGPLDVIAEVSKSRDSKDFATAAPVSEALVTAGGDAELGNSSRQDAASTTSVEVKPESQPGAGLVSVPDKLPHSVAWLENTFSNSAVLPTPDPECQNAGEATGHAWYGTDACKASSVSSDAACRDGKDSKATPKQHSAALYSCCPAFRQQSIDEVCFCTERGPDIGAFLPTRSQLTKEHHEEALGSITDADGEVKIGKH